MESRQDRMHQEDCKDGFSQENEISEYRYIYYIDDSKVKPPASQQQAINSYSYPIHSPTRLQISHVQNHVEAS